MVEQSKGNIQLRVGWYIDSHAATGRYLQT